MSKLRTTVSSSEWINDDDDSGIGLDRDYSSSTLVESISSTVNLSTVSLPQGVRAESLVEFPLDGTTQRIRPTTMKNSVNGDYIICYTARGTYVAQRTLIIPQWVLRLAEEVDRQQR